jgi:signal transduction histidine kinase
MNFRTKLFVVVTLAVLGGTGWVTWRATRSARREFEQADRERSDTLVAQFQRALAEREQEVAIRVQGIANSEATLRMALELGRPQADPSLYVNDARGLAESHRLDFVELVGNDGTVISSAQWPGHVGYKNDLVTQQQNWGSQAAFLQPVQLADGVELGLIAVRVVHVGDSSLYIIAGQRFDRGFLRMLVPPPGTRALVYDNLESAFVPTALADQDGPLAQADRFAPLIEAVRQQRRPIRRTIQWNAGPASAETFNLLPLTGRQKQLLGVLLVGTSQKDAVAAAARIRTAGVAIAGAGILFAFFLSGWASMRVTRPLGRLAGGMREVAAGNWGHEIRVRSRDEAGRAVRAFNEMTSKLGELRARLLQSERTVARREVAHRVEQELKDPLFPLQLVVENLRRAREETNERFDEIFFESLDTLSSEIGALKASVARFSEFAKMPPPRLEAVNVSESVREALKQFEPQFSAVGRPPITPELYLDEKAACVQADPALLHRALESLVLRSLEAMPSGGTITARTAQQNGKVRIEIADTGAGLKPEECQRLFTPYYATRRHGADLGLATVQAVVQDHGGRVWAESAPGAGTTFYIELPVAAGARRSKASPAPWPQSQRAAGSEAETETPVQPPVPSITSSTKEG